MQNLKIVKYFFLHNHLIITHLYLYPYIEYILSAIKVLYIIDMHSLKITLVNLAAQYCKQLNQSNKFVSKLFETVKQLSKFVRLYARP